MFQSIQNKDKGLFQSLLFGLISAIVFVLIWDSPFEKYKVEIDPFAFDRWDEETLWFVDDFDGDGNSERIRCFHGVNSNSLDVVHYDPQGNITGHYQTGTDEWPPQLLPGIIDIGHDQKKELVFFSLRNDSIFLNLFSLTDFEPIGQQKFFAEFKIKNDVYACTAVIKDLVDLDNNGTDELFFSFDAGYGIYPRGIFRIDFPSMEIRGSNTGYMKLGISSFQDLDQDGVPEILVGCGAPNNTAGMDLDDFSDTLSYLTILDYDLNFFLPPVPFQGVYSSVAALADPRTDEYLYVSYYCRTNSVEPLKLMTVSTDGKILAEKSWKNIENPESLHIFLQELNDRPYALIYDIGRFELDKNLTKLPENLDEQQNDFTSRVESADLDHDGYDELILSNLKDEVTIINEKARSVSTFESPIEIDRRLDIFEKRVDGKFRKHILISSGGFFSFTYTKNQLYYLNYLIFLAVFGISAFVIRWILLGQKKRMEKKWETEKQLSELQFNSVKNQLNPHFLFNALNSVAFMIQEGKKEEAYDFLSANSRMIQRMMNDAQEVKRPLSDELQFTKDFVDIQQRRFKDRFSTRFDIAPSVNLDFEVPKMCIHTYVENAIKHGFRNTKTGGQLLVKIRPLTNGVNIEISDNGMGRKAADKYDDSTGMGIAMMKEFYRLFEKYHGYKIESSVADPESGKGTRVMLSIKKPLV